jgi:hypothetical protein
MLSYDKQLKAISQHLKKNMTDAEKRFSGFPTGMSLRIWVE